MHSGAVTLPFITQQQNTIMPYTETRLTREAYDALPGLSYSGMKELMRSPAHYRHWLTAPKEETKALRIGKAVHAAALQPDAFRATYAMAPEVDRRTKDGKATWEHAVASLKPGQSLLPNEEYMLALTLADKVREVYPLDKGVAEFPIVAKDASTPIKGIPDLITEDGWVVDLKTTESVDQRDITRTVLNYGYHMQAAHYIRLAQSVRDEVKGFILLFVEKEPPHGVRVVQIAGEFLELGRKRTAEACALFDQCTKNDSWPAPEDEGTLVLDTLPGSPKAKPDSVLTF